MLSMNLYIKGQRIAYVMGSGDEIPASLELMGYSVDQLTPADLTDHGSRRLRCGHNRDQGLEHGEGPCEHANEPLEEYVAQTVEIY